MEPDWDIPPITILVFELFSGPPGYILFTLSRIPLELSDPFGIYVLKLNVSKFCKFLKVKLIAPTLPACTISASGVVNSISTFDPNSVLATVNFPTFGNANMIRISTAAPIM